MAQTDVGDDLYGASSSFAGTSYAKAPSSPQYPFVTSGATAPYSSQSSFTAYPDPSNLFAGKQNALENAMGGLSLNSPESVPVTRITSQKHRSEADMLDPSLCRHPSLYILFGSDCSIITGYKVVPSKDSKWFWKFGRVFMMLWTEPAGYKASGRTANSHISVTWLNETAYSEIRRFVVVQDCYGSVQCL